MAKFWCCLLILSLFIARPVAAGSLFSEDAVFADAARGNSAAVEEYLLSGNNPNIRDGKKVPLLLYAAMAGNPKTIRALIRHRARLDLTDTLGNTALIQAAAYGSMAVIKLLVENGARVNEENRQGETALIKAAKNGHLAVVQILLDEGADPAISDFTGRTALDHAIQNRQPEIAHLLTKVSS